MDQLEIATLSQYLKYLFLFNFTVSERNQEHVDKHKNEMFFLVFISREHC